METGQQLLRDVAAIILGGIITFIVQHFRRPQTLKDEHVTAQQGLVERQTKTLDDVWEMIDKLTERLNKVEEENEKLRDELRKWRNAYARAIRWINEKKMNDVPDFLMDTGPKTKAIK